MIERYENGALLLQFGTGDIGIHIGGSEGCGALMFKGRKPTKIGVLNIGGSAKTADTRDFPVSMMFTNEDSIEAFIQSLMTAKKIMTGEIIMRPAEE